MSSSLRPHGLYSPWNTPGQNTGMGSHLFSRDLPNPGIKLRSPTLQSDSLPVESPGKPLKDSGNSLVKTAHLRVSLFCELHLLCGCFHYSCNLKVKKPQKQKLYQVLNNRVGKGKNPSVSSRARQSLHAPNTGL